MNYYRPSRRRRGSNQYRERTRGHWKRWLIVYAIAVILIILFAQYYKNQGKAEAYSEAYILSPLPDNGQFNVDIQAEPVVPSEKEQIIAYITKLWEKHGTQEVVHAINCFYSESGLRSDAYGINKNGTNDAGVAQINSIHKMSVEERFNWKKNLDKAYEIYTSWGNSWDAWYGRSC